MVKKYNIWKSSEKHLNVLKEIKILKYNLRNVLDLDIDDKFYDFPRKFVNENVFPVIFDSIGELIISDETIQFCTNQLENYEYQGINKINNISISYDQITNIELIRYKIAFIRYFDNFWIKISYLDNGIHNSILFSNSGKGFVMKEIKRKNIELIAMVESKINKVAL